MPCYEVHEVHKVQWEEILEVTWQLAFATKDTTCVHYTFTPETVGHEVDDATGISVMEVGKRGTNIHTTIFDKDHGQPASEYAPTHCFKHGDKDPEATGAEEAKVKPDTQLFPQATDTSGSTGDMVDNTLGRLGAGEKMVQKSTVQPGSTENSPVYIDESKGVTKKKAEENKE